MWHKSKGKGKGKSKGNGNLLTEMREETDDAGVALYDVLFDEGKGKCNVKPSKRWKVLRPRDEGKDKVNVKARTKWLRSMNPWHWIL